jgi:hypothetical protein
METELRKLQVQVDSYEKDMRKKQLQIDLKKKAAEQQYREGSETMGDQYVAEAAMRIEELNALSDARTRTMALMTEMQKTAHQMRLDKNFAAAADALGRANKLGASRGAKMDKVVMKTEKQLTSISSSSSSTSAFLESRMGGASAAAQDLKKQLMDKEYEDLGLVLPDSPPAVANPPSKASPHAETSDLERRINKLKEKQHGYQLMHPIIVRSLIRSR